MIGDPTYDKEKIAANPVWELAYYMSELYNKTTPIGWSKYIPMAKGLLDKYEIKRKPGKT